MENWLKSLLITEDDHDPKFVNLLRNVLSIILVVLVLLIGAQSGILGNGPKLDIVIILATIAALTGLFIYLLNLKMVWPAKVFLPIAMLVSVTYFIASANGLHDVAVMGYPLIIFIASLFLGRRTLPFWATITSFCIVLVGYWDITGHTPEPIARTTGIDTITIGILVILASTGVANALMRRFEEIIAGSRKNEAEQIRANKDLRELQTTLEQRVEERTNELEERNIELNNVNKRIQRRAAQFEALTQVTQSITAIRDIQELLPHITTVISEKFNFYHVGIFLLDEAYKYAILIAANSDGGKRMLERKHRLRVGQEGIVGYTASTGKPRIALNIGTDATYFNNPDLPGTRSEVALPLISKHILAGVLDVQSTELQAFSDDDVQMLSLLADQVSLAIENARLFDESRKALTESEMMSRSSIRETWARLPEKENLLGFRYNMAGAAPLRKKVELKKPISAGTKPMEAGSATTVVPIELRGEMIGSLIVQSPSGNQWTADQLDLIKAVAERVALSAENARLFDETTARAEREKLVSEITSKIRSNTDPQAMIQTAVDELRSALGAAHIELIPQTSKGAEKSET